MLDFLHTSPSWHKRHRWTDAWNSRDRRKQNEFGASNPADESELTKARSERCKSETCWQADLVHRKTGRARLCTVRLGSTLYSRRAVAFVSAYRCVCWCLKQPSILLKSTHSCLTMRQSSNVLVNTNPTHQQPHPRPLRYYLSLFFLSALKP